MIDKLIWISNLIRACSTLSRVLLLGGNDKLVKTAIHNLDDAYQELKKQLNKT